MTALPLLWAVLLVTGAWTIRPPARSRRTPARPSSLGATRPVIGPRAVEVIVLVLAVEGPVALAAVVAGATLALPIWTKRRARQARRDEVVRSLPEIVDLVRLAIGSGLTVPLAVDAVGRHGAGPIAVELRVVTAEVALGRRVGDALADVPGRTDEAVRPLIDALVASDRYGAPLGDALARLAAEVRADRRRRAEEAARRVPVKLLFPLVCCVLPAFGLLTLAPLIAGAVDALRL